MPDEQRGEITSNLEQEPNFGIPKFRKSGRKLQRAQNKSRNMIFEGTILVQLAIIIHYNKLCGNDLQLCFH